MNYAAFFLLGLLVLPAVFSACGNNDPEELRFTGVVRWKELEGGFFAIDADDGEKYDPIGLPEEFREDGLRVNVVARPRPDSVSIRMYGTPIEIISIEAAERRSTRSHRKVSDGRGS